MRAAILSLGCKVNQYDAAAMEELLRAAGYTIVPFEDKADVYLVATCTVTETADKKSRQMLARARRRNPDAIVVAAGCYAQSEREKLLALGVDLVIGNSERSNIVQMLTRAYDGEKNCIARDFSRDEAYESLSACSYDGHTRAYLKIQEGCNNFCSYCIIPYMRGCERSLSPDELRAQTEKIASRGFREIVLTGINLTSYGREYGVDLADAVAICASVKGIERVRLGSIDVPKLDDAFLERLARVPAFCPHFHISLQSGSTSVLKRMNRHYTADEYAEAVARIRHRFHHAFITTDIITGFPGETEEEFAESCRFVERIAFGKVHVFPYSQRKGTAAADRTQVPVHVRRERAERLIAVAERIAGNVRATYVGYREQVLVEKNDCGHTRTYLYARLDRPAEPGSIVDVEIVGTDEMGVLAKIL